MKMLKRFVKRLLSCLLLAALFVLVVIGGTLGVQGWRLYRATAAQKPIASLYDEISSRPGFASCDQLPQTYIDAVISVEDSRFERHHGIDPAAIVRALWADLRTRSLAEGGSTLTQQLAKNELFTQEKQMARKAAEMFAARDIEDYYSKQQIFEMYAGSCYFGNQWSGVAQAAQGYFGKPTRELTRAECVVLAGLPNAPSVYAANGELARRRALVVVERMERAKKLTHTQALEPCPFGEKKQNLSGFSIKTPLSVRASAQRRGVFLCDQSIRFTNTGQSTAVSTPATAMDRPLMAPSTSPICRALLVPTAWAEVPMPTPLAMGSVM